MFCNTVPDLKATSRQQLSMVSKHRLNVSIRFMLILSDAALLSAKRHVPGYDAILL